LHLIQDSSQNQPSTVILKKSQVLPRPSTEPDYPKKNILKLLII
jgi:hypothetical protein